MKEPNYISKVIIAHYSVVKTDQSLVYRAQVDLYQFTKITNIFRVGTLNHLFKKNEHSGGGGGGGNDLIGKKQIVLK